MSARRIALWTMLAAKLAGAWGVGWDIRWHVVIGRDSFWIPPHLTTYGAVVVVATVSLGVLLLDTRAAWSGRRPSGTVRVLGLVGTPGFHLAWWGMALTLAAAPVDDLWHRLFGLDVTLWSPPHLLGFAGAQINTLGCLIVAVEVLRGSARARGLAELAAGVLLLGFFEVFVEPGIRSAFLGGGVWFFTYGILGALAFTFTLVLVARLSDWRSAPLVVAAGAVALQLSVTAVGDAGFALLRPPSRLDARRRWATGAAAFGTALLVVSGVVLARSPALAHALPAMSDLGPAVALTLVAALAGGAGAARLADLVLARRPAAATLQNMGGSGRPPSPPTLGAPRQSRMRPSITRFVHRRAG